MAITATTTFETGFYLSTNLLCSKDDIGPQEAAVEWPRGPIVAGHRAPGVLAAPLNGTIPITPRFIVIDFKTKLNCIFRKNKP
jgi:hypothetical protein